MQLFQPSKQCHLLFPGWKFHPKVCSASIFNCEISCCQKKWSCLNLASGGKSGEGGEIGFILLLQGMLNWFCLIGSSAACPPVQDKPKGETFHQDSHHHFVPSPWCQGCLCRASSAAFPALATASSLKSWIWGDSKVLRHWHSAWCCDLL